ncbi:hypothetical protein H2198_002549 [Neophaeococcomyces mojaviensis]|uniref:Uncharacterized protein n=1 Tax=Neophaeococcomyces mojaviensis TaxID=3383035 RepID=A0ACC3AER4_9EURO|nr:hypothetical protein H2198_002549 [Knufia sp. JES_112]
MASRTNSSFVLFSPQNVGFEDRPEPQISDPHEVLLRIKSTGICGSDVHYYNHGRIGKYEVRSPMVLGHESAGVVIKVGPKVTTVKIGDQVALEPGICCRYCVYCRKGIYNLCPKMQFAATPPFDGTLCDVYCLPEDFCHKLPDTLSLDEGAMAEPLSVAVHVMLKQASVKFGDQVVVFGAGPIGLLCCAVARAYGAGKIVAVDINEARLLFAKRYAATDVINATTTSKDATEAAAMISKKAHVQTGGADIVVDASGVESSIRAGIHIVKPGGTFVQAGMGRDDVNFPIAAMCSKELHVKGSFRYGPGDYECAIKLIETGKVDVASLITDIVPFEQAEDAFRGMSGGNSIKTVIRGPSMSTKMPSQA